MLTGSPPWLPPSRTSGPDERTTKPVLTVRNHPLDLSSPPRSLPTTAPASRPFGRYAVGLRPSLDPDAYFDAPSKDKEAAQNEPKQHSRWS